MTEAAGIQFIDSKPNTNNDIKVLDNLLLRTETLPDILYLRAAELGYEFTDEDKKLIIETYSKLDDILKEVAAFIHIKFPGCERHVRAWNEIDFDTKIGPIKIITTDREHIKREWRNGMFDLKSLIKVLRNETILLVEEKENITSSQNKNENLATNTNDVVSSDSSNEKRSWLEVFSWIAGIVGTIISLYALLA